MDSFLVPWPLRLSTPVHEGVLRVSKWQKFQVLLDAEEMRSLFTELSCFFIYVVSEAVTAQSAAVEREEFLSRYAEYVSSLKEGSLPTEAPLRRYFSSIFTVTPEVLYAMEVGREKFLIKALRPIIQLQAHHFFFSSLDGKFHPMVLSQDSVTWGLQFSYPQIYQSPHNHSFSKIIDSQEFPNTALFARLAKWIRHNTLPTPFIVDSVQTNVPLRLGKKCFPWICGHPQLRAKKIAVLPWKGSEM